MSFQLVVLATFIASIRGQRPKGFDPGRWAYPVNVAMAYGVGMLVNVVYPGALTSARAELYSYGWTTLAVKLVVLVIGASV